jgi:hypothetical protein
MAQEAQLMHRSGLISTDPAAGSRAIAPVRQAIWQGAGSQ